MRSTPYISVIIPSFNSAPTIAASISSVIGQKFRDLEVMIMDGGSSDGTLDIISSFAGKDQRVTSVSEKDEGVYDAINKGINRSRGQWIYILGSDDAVYDESTFVNVAEKLKNADAPVVYGNVKVHGDAAWAKDGTIHDGEFSLAKLLQRNICQQSVFYRREIFKRLGMFNKEYRVCADWDFMLRCASRFELKYIDDVVANFSAGGVSSSGKEKKFYDDLPENLKKYFGRRIWEPEFAPLAFRFRKYAGECAASGRRWKAWYFRKLSDRLEKIAPLEPQNDNVLS